MRASTTPRRRYATDTLWTCPTKGCGFWTSQPRLVHDTAHRCPLNRDHLAALKPDPATKETQP